MICFWQRLTEMYTTVGLLSLLQPKPHWWYSYTGICIFIAARHYIFIKMISHVYSYTHGRICFHSQSWWPSSSGCTSLSLPHSQPLDHFFCSVTCSPSGYPTASFSRLVSSSWCIPFLACPSIFCSFFPTI